MANDVNAPLVSVVIPAFNCEHVLARSVGSALSQTYQNLQVILVDDGSTDATHDVGKGLAESDARVYLIHQDSCRGGSAARNVGIAEASGELLAFLDADDEWCPDKIDRQVKKYQRLDDGLVVLYCSYRIRNKRGQRKTVPRRSIMADESIADYLFCNRGFIQTSGLLLSRELAKQVQFPEWLPRHQDYAFLFGLENQCAKFVRVPDAHAIYYQNPGNLGAKGWNPEVSREFATAWSDNFTRDSLSRFMFIYTVLAVARNGRGMGQMASGLKTIRLSSLSWRNWAALGKVLCEPVLEHGRKLKRVRGLR